MLKRIVNLSNFANRRPAFGLNCRRTHSLRNVGIVAHIDAGKTTTTENMIYMCGQINSIGRVDSGDTVMDFLPQERERGITISSATIQLLWKKHCINVIDTPGHVDFTFEVARSARVLDGVVLIVDAVAGVQAQTQTVWKQTNKQGIPAVAFVNKMDRAGASFNRSVLSLKKKLGCTPIPIQYPVGADESYTGLVDLISLTKLIWDAKSTSRAPSKPEVSRLSSSDPYYDDVIQARRNMIQTLAEVDEQIMDTYLNATVEELDAFAVCEEQELVFSVQDMLGALKRTCLDRSLIPTLCGASLRGKGVEPLIDSIITFLPSPAERAPTVMNIAAPTTSFSAQTKGKQKAPKHNKKNALAAKLPSSITLAQDRKDFCALAFKVVHDNNKGPLVYFRVFSGVVSQKQVLYNSTKGVKERVQQLIRVSGDDQELLEEVGPGSVGCVVGLKHTVTGDTLVCAEADNHSDLDIPLQQYVLDGLTIPESVYSVSIEPERSSQQTELDEALRILSMEDPSLRIDVNKESGQTMIKGLGELHLDIVCDKLDRQFNLKVTTGKAYVGYQETIMSNSHDRTSGTPFEFSNRFTYDRTIGLKRLFACITFDVTVKNDSFTPQISISPDLYTEGNLKNELTTEEAACIVNALTNACVRGPKGYPIVGLNIHVSSVEKFGTDSSIVSGGLRACSANFVDRLFRNQFEVSDGVSSLLLEPIMSLECEVPVDFMGEVLSDLTVLRRAQIKELVAKNPSDEADSSAITGNTTVYADVPFATMLGYATTIRSMTQGEGSFSMEYVHHKEVV